MDKNDPTEGESDADEQGGPDDRTHESQSQPRIPAPDPAAHEEGKRFIVGSDGNAPPLAVTITDGKVARDYAPADLISKLAAHVYELLRDVGGGFPPMLYGAVPTNSMTLYFGDPRPDGAQGQFPVEAVLSHAKRVAALMQLEGDELFANALELGAPARRYSELAHFVDSEGVTLKWEPRDEEPRILTPQQASVQYARLNAEPHTKDQTMTINGTLYRIIAEPQQGRLGTAAQGTLGIRLFGWSSKPPSRHRQGQKVIALYLDDKVESSIRKGLIGSAAEARLVIRRPDLGTAIDPEVVELIVEAIKQGPTEKSRLGISFIDDAPDDM